MRGPPAMRSLLYAVLLSHTRAGTDDDRHHCSGHGTTSHSKDFECTCMSGWKGPNCGVRACPRGRAWADYASATDEAHAYDTECSGQGYCNEEGVCECREGVFEGPACEKLACPQSWDGLTCSGHGQCVTSGWAASHWDGRNLVRPHVSYPHWDAEKISGCLCDRGFSGFNCSRFDCPRGDIPETRGQKNEVVRLECEASSGSFTMTYKGGITEPIPWDAPYGLLKARLQTLPDVGEVSVRYLRGAFTICGTPRVEAEVEFLTDFGPLPALKAQALSLDGSVQFVTRQRLRCPRGSCHEARGRGPSNCTGGFYLGYDGHYTSKLAYDATKEYVERALRRLPTLNEDSDYGPLSVNVSGSDTVCAVDEKYYMNSTDGYDTMNAQNITIEMRGAYGNVYNLTLLNSLWRVDSYTDPSYAYKEKVNLTLEADKGTKENTYCSDRGWCDFATGTCMCNKLDTGALQYDYMSSNGYGEPGTRGDCGYPSIEARGCPAGLLGDTWVQCGGKDRGTCDNATLVCLCNENHYGAACMLQTCPFGQSWWGEARGSDKGHALAECSNMGECERNSGLCDCREGFGGNACEKLLCPVNRNDGSYCSGHGSCLPLWRAAQEVTDAHPHGLSYGAATQQSPATWDSRRIHMCHCDSRDGTRPADGPVEWVSGVYTANDDFVGGWTGYDCSQRRCPFGDDPRTDSDVSEIQMVRCSTQESFTVTFRGDTSRPISANASADTVKWALENMTTLQEVRVAISPGEVACQHRWDGSAWRHDASGFNVTFVSQVGDVPLLSTSPSSNVTETVKGTKENLECGRQGYCDPVEGLCRCLKGFVGSDGDGNPGRRRDCGRLDPQGFTLNLWDE